MLASGWCNVSTVHGTEEELDGCFAPLCLPRPPCLPPRPFMAGALERTQQPEGGAGGAL